MPGKKAHKPKNTGNAGPTAKPFAKGRKSAGQTQGHLERDQKHGHGQFSGAGDAPLIKK